MDPLFLCYNHDNAVYSTPHIAYTQALRDRLMQGCRWSYRCYQIRLTLDKKGLPITAAIGPPNSCSRDADADAEFTQYWQAPLTSLGKQRDAEISRHPDSHEATVNTQHLTIVALQPNDLNGKPPVLRDMLLVCSTRNININERRYARLTIWNAISRAQVGDIIHQLWTKADQELTPESRNIESDFSPADAEIVTDILGNGKDVFSELPPELVLRILAFLIDHEDAVSYTDHGAEICSRLTQPPPYFVVNRRLAGLARDACKRRSLSLSSSDWQKTPRPGGYLWPYDLVDRTRFMVPTTSSHAALLHARSIAIEMRGTLKVGHPTITELSKILRFNRNLEEIKIISDEFAPSIIEPLRQMYLSDLVRPIMQVIDPEYADAMAHSDVSGLNDLSETQTVNLVSLMTELGSDTAVQHLLGYDQFRCSQETIRDLMSLACYMGHLNVFHTLVRTEIVDINRIGSNERTLLMDACEGGKVNVAEWLLSHPDIDVNKRNKDGFTALHYASAASQESMIKLLGVSHSAQLNVQNEAGDTPLMVACRAGNLAAVDSLLELGASQILRNLEGRTSQDIETVSESSSSSSSGTLCQRLLNSTPYLVDVPFST